MGKKKQDDSKSKNNSNRSDKLELDNVETVNQIVRDISKQIVDNINKENYTENQLLKQKNSTNPRKPFPYSKVKKTILPNIENIQENRKPRLITANQVRHNPELYNRLNNNFYNSGCKACKRRLWDPI